MPTIYHRRAKPKAHPGWAVRLGDGSWVSSAHGLFPEENAGLAVLEDTKEEAEQLLKYFAEDWKHDPALLVGAEVIVAWEPCCEHLRFKMKQLQAALLITPDQINEVYDKLEETKDLLAEASFFHRKKEFNAEPTTEESDSD